MFSNFFEEIGPVVFELQHRTNKQTNKQTNKLTNLQTEQSNILGKSKILPSNKIKNSQAQGDHMHDYSTPIG